MSVFAQAVLFSSAAVFLASGLWSAVSKTSEPAVEKIFGIGFLLALGLAALSAALMAL